MTGPAVPLATRARDLLDSEWTKLRSVRSTYLALIGSAVFAVGVGIFSAVTVKASHVDWTTFDPVSTSLSGLLFVQLVFGVFGALAITSEYATGMIRTTFTAVPRRRAVLGEDGLVARIGHPCMCRERASGSGGVARIAEVGGVAGLGVRRIGRQDQR